MNCIFHRDVGGGGFDSVKVLVDSELSLTPGSSFTIDLEAANPKIAHGDSNE